MERGGRLPPEVQRDVNFAAAVSACARQADAAKVLLKYLAAPDAVRVMKANGLEPPG